MNFIKKIIVSGYFILCLIAIDLFSTFDHEFMVGEGEFINICVAFKALVVDDTRDVMAPALFLMLLPFLIMSLRKKIERSFYYPHQPF